MKVKILELMAFFLFTGSIGYIVGTLGSLQLNHITIGQAITRGACGAVLLVLSSVLINTHWKEGRWL